MTKQNKTTKSLIHYYITDENNSNETILFIHPAFLDHRTFDNQVEFFSKQYKVITIDLIGHGKSQNLKTKDKIHNTKDHIKEILDIENISKVHLVGISIGALLAQDFANTYPNMTSSLTAVGGYDISNYDSSIEKSQRKEQVGFMLKALFSIEAFSRANANISAYTSKAQNDFYEINLQYKRSSFKYMTTLNSIMNQSQSERIYPLLIMYGQYDSPLAISLASKWHASLSDSELVVISDAGHCANMDNPELFNNSIFNFINK